MSEEKKRGRPPKKNPKTRTVQIRVTEEEWNDIEKALDVYGFRRTMPRSRAKGQMLHAILVTSVNAILRK